MLAPVVSDRDEVVLESIACGAGGDGGDPELRADGVDHGAAELGLVGEVPVERGRLHAELTGQASDRQRRGTFGVHQGDRPLDDVLAGQPGAPPAGSPARRLPLTGRGWPAKLGVIDQ